MNLRKKMSTSANLSFLEASKPRGTIRADAEIPSANLDPISKRLYKLDAFWRFLRPHTIRGTVICSISLFSRGLIENSHLIHWWLFPKALCALIGLICGNGYIVGINQIYDIEIDKMNKPYLPIAAGDISVPEAWLLVLLLAVVGLALVGINSGPFLIMLSCLGLFLGTIYSVPPFRMKRFPVAAFLIISTVRGFMLNYGVYYATMGSLGLKFQWSPPMIFITMFVTIFALVIAITKDLPDIEGDRKFQISTLATNLGVRNIAFLGSGLLLTNYVCAILVAFYMPQEFRGSLMAFGHAILALCLGYQTWILDHSNYTQEGNTKYYKFIWKLFYSEYLLFMFI